MSFQSAALSETPAIQPLTQILRLAPGRTHELCGPARQVLAVWVIAQHPPGTPVIWIRPSWKADRLYPQALCDWISPEGLIIIETARESEALACAEESLRSGAVALVVAELGNPLALTPLRRLHLAAQTGLERRSVQAHDSTVMGLILTPENGGSAGVESRWHLAPCPASGNGVSLQSAWILQRLRARTLPPATWTLHKQPQKEAMHCVMQKAR
jgi:protein ImuA